MHRAPFPTPRVLWIELSSRCSFECVFCSRKARRGPGQDLPFPLYERLMAELQDPRLVILNYSGESTCYPELVPAVRLARARGARVELVTVLAAGPAGIPAALAAAGLDRITVSVHTMDPVQYPKIHGRGSLETLTARVRELCATPGAPAVDFAFVAMDRNLNQVEAVAAFAESVGVGSLTVFPVLRRDEIPEPFHAELDGCGGYRPAFCDRLSAAVGGAAWRHPAVRVAVANPPGAPEPGPLGEAPVPYPWPLPPGARIHGCGQDPWETAHVLSNGDVVPCEATDRLATGNLKTEPLAAIWLGERYQRFRDAWQNGGAPECVRCPWKRAWVPGPLRAEVVAARGASAQLLAGWHERSGEDLVWSTREAAAVLRPRRCSRTLHVSGVLPPGTPGEPNRLTIACNGAEAGAVENPWEDPMPFGLDFAVPDSGGAPWNLAFQTRRAFRPAADARDLGFALALLASKRPAVETPHDVRALRRWVGRVDRAGAALRRLGWRLPRPAMRTGRPGLSVVIPERHNPEELQACLASLENAAAGLAEPVEVTVVVNGTPPPVYDRLRSRHPGFQWRFHERQLGFARAIRDGLRHSRFDWVYLLNNDVALEPPALREVLALRAPDVFAVGSQIFFKDRTRFREETNRGSLALEDGLVAIRDLIPSGEDAAECFYVGGGASLFQRGLLKRLSGGSEAYAPFYWEDVEWGWRARKLGFRAIFAPGSRAHHRHRATIARHYTEDQVEEVCERNRYLFQLRNVTAAGSLDRLFEEIARAPRECFDYLSRPGVLAGIAACRMWNHAAPVAVDGDWGVGE